MLIYNMKKVKTLNLVSKDRLICMIADAVN